MPFLSQLLSDPTWLCMYVLYIEVHVHIDTVFCCMLCVHWSMCACVWVVEERNGGYAGEALLSPVKYELELPTLQLDVYVSHATVPAYPYIIPY